MPYHVVSVFYFVIYIHIWKTRIRTSVVHDRQSIPNSLCLVGEICFDRSMHVFLFPKKLGVSSASILDFSNQHINYVWETMNLVHNQWQEFINHMGTSIIHPKLWKWPVKRFFPPVRILTHRQFEFYQRSVGSLRSVQPMRQWQVVSVPANNAPAGVARKGTISKTSVHTGPLYQKNWLVVWNILDFPIYWE